MRKEDSLLDKLNMLKNDCTPMPGSFDDNRVTTAVNDVLQFWCALTDIQRQRVADVKNNAGASLELCLLMFFVHTPGLKFPEDTLFGVYYERLLALPKMYPAVDVVFKHLDQICEPSLFARIKPARIPSRPVGGSAIFQLPVEGKRSLTPETPKTARGERTEQLGFNRN